MNTHTWNVDTTNIIGPPIAAPGVWPIQKNTNLTEHEISSLQNAGFVLKMGMEGTRQVQQITTARIDRSFRPRYRNGKLVQWRSKLTKDFQNRVELGGSIQAKVLREEIVINNEAHVFYVNTEGSKAAGVSYAVTIAEFLGCSCPDFQVCETKHACYVLASTCILSTFKF